MFHMLSCFNLKAGENIATFQSAYTGFVASMRRAGGLVRRASRGTSRSLSTMRRKADILADIV